MSGIDHSAHLVCYNKKSKQHALSSPFKPTKAEYFKSFIRFKTIDIKCKSPKGSSENEFLVAGNPGELRHEDPCWG